MITLENLCELIYLTFFWKYPVRESISAKEQDIETHYTELSDALRLEVASEDLSKTHDGRELIAYMQRQSKIVTKFKNLDHRRTKLIRKYHLKGKQLWL